MMRAECRDGSRAEEGKAGAMFDFPELLQVSKPETLIPEL